MLMLSREAHMTDEEKRVVYESDIRQLIERSNQLHMTSIQLDQAARRASMRLADLHQRSAAALMQSEQVQRRYAHAADASIPFSHARHSIRHNS
jgi:hypothetical protein